MALRESPANKRIPSYHSGPRHGDEGHQIFIEDFPKRVRAIVNGVTIADSTRLKILFEDGHLPIYYFPTGDVRMDHLSKTTHRTHCPYKGDCSYWTITVGNHRAENAVWGYEDPIPASRAIAGHLAFYWNKVDHWLEEDEEIHTHPRDPYKRIDCLRSSRQVQVVVGGEVVADTRRAIFLFETHLPTRYYIPKEDVRAGVLSPSDLQTSCAYKGFARYLHVTVGGKKHENLVWYYPEPETEVLKIMGLLAFYNEKVDAILIDGKAEPKPLTMWS
ncbi:MAG: DUF427 domain-containing protein [Alphaproteobacteria bacterium]|nr:DUF427 domain-containing protein [Alphaproteobacteria bacterium]